MKSSEELFKHNVVKELSEGFYLENQSLEGTNRLFAEFNSLAVIYGIPSIQFINEQYLMVGDVMMMIHVLMMYVYDVYKMFRMCDLYTLSKHLNCYTYIHHHHRLVLHAWISSYVVLYIDCRYQ